MTALERDGAAPAVVPSASRAPVPAATLRSLLVPVYLPALLFAIGQGAVIPVIPLLAREVGASVAAAGVVVAARGIGTMAFDVPAGSLVGRFGEKRTVVLGTALLVASALGCIASASPGAVGAFVFVMGCGWSVWLLARLSFVSDAVAPANRGRALSTLGGVNRMGNFVGPFLGAAVIASFGLEAAFVVQAVAAIAACALLVSVPGDDDGAGADAPAVDHGPIRFRAILVEHAGVFGTAGLAASCISMLRAARQVIIPLWGDHIGLAPAEIAMVFGASSALDMALFYPSGLLSDRWGRKAAAVPCLGVLSAGLVLLPLAGSSLLFALVALVLGAGNGIGTGIVMTLGADLSPAHGRAEFLGVWRLVTDVGQAGGPLLISLAAGAASLGAASVALGALGLAGAGLAVRYVPETLER